MRHQRTVSGRESVARQLVAATERTRVQIHTGPAALLQVAPDATLRP
ncbi:hypothetical protein [Streptomyces sp. NPDC058964]